MVLDDLLKSDKYTAEDFKCAVIETSTLQMENEPIVLTLNGKLQEFLDKLKFNHDDSAEGIHVDSGTIWLKDGTWIEASFIGGYDGEAPDLVWKHRALPLIPGVCAEIPTEYLLSHGVVIRAKKDLRAKSSSWNTPENIDVPKGTTLMVMATANNGDVFVKLMEGVCTLHSRARDREGETIELRVNTYGGSDFILNQGHKSRHPYDWGLIDLEFWEVVRDENETTNS